MKLEYTLTLADAKAAERLHIRQKLGRRIGYGFLYVGIPVLAVCGLICFYAFNIGATGDWSLIYSMTEVVLIFWSIVIPIDRKKRLRRFINRQVPSSEGKRLNSIVIDDEKVVLEKPEVVRTEFYWKAIVSFVQDEQVTMLYVNAKEFILFPTTAITPTQGTELNDLVARHITSRKP